MRIAVDVKNLALYHGGIAQFFAPLLRAWISHRPNDEFLLVGPEFDKSFLGTLPNFRHVQTNWPSWLPGPLRHPYYDNVAFPKAVKRLKADFVISPYHDVRLEGRAAKVMMIHDVCLDELARTYPRRIRLYYLAMLRYNLRRVQHVVTVSQTSAKNIVERYQIPPTKVHVVYNACHSDFLSAKPSSEEIKAVRRQYDRNARLLFYPGGSEYRKNVEGLLGAFSLLNPVGNERWQLLVTGMKDARWSRLLESVNKGVAARVVFLGHLDNSNLKQHYLAADCVIYPTLCEGFGRVCLEAMASGAPLACSDLPVLREVASDYSAYFDPHDATDMARAIQQATAKGHVEPIYDPRFQLDAVQQRFLDLMDHLMATPANA